MKPLWDIFDQHWGPTASRGAGTDLVDDDADRHAAAAPPEESAAVTADEISSTTVVDDSVTMMDSQLVPDGPDDQPMPFDDSMDEPMDEEDEELLPEDSQPLFPEDSQPLPDEPLIPEDSQPLIPDDSQPLTETVLEDSQDPEPSLVVGEESKPANGPCPVCGKVGPHECADSDPGPCRDELNREMDSQRDDLRKKIQRLRCSFPFQNQTCLRSFKNGKLWQHVGMKMFKNFFIGFWLAGPLQGYWRHRPRKGS